MFTPGIDSTIFTYRGLTVRHFPNTHHYVYLIHFQQPYKHARHYLGSSSHLDERLKLHKSGNGARLMQVVSQAGIAWELARLWECETWEESRALERRFKRWHGSTKLCPICQGKPLDALVLLRQGHWPFSACRVSGKRAPLGAHNPTLVRRAD